MLDAAIAFGSAAADRRAIDDALMRICDDSSADLAPRIAAAIRYALEGEGKRIRGLLVLHAYRACGGSGDASSLAAAVEVVHAYSLVHDDLPCMDDDDVRRGRATVHRAFDVETATIAGIASVPLAARAAYRASLSLGLTPGEAGSIVADLMRASGAGGMIGGQLLDLEAEGVALGVDALERIHRGKTGALIEASTRIGGRAARASAAQLEAFTRYGAALGLAFQIADDVLDVTQSTEVLGKTAGRDIDLHKSTYPALLGIEGAQQRARALSEEACRALREAAIDAPPLEFLARFAVDRRS